MRAKGGKSMIVNFENISLNLKYLLLDYTGTLSEHGKLINCVKEKLLILSNNFEKIIVLTADTFGTAHKELKNFPVEVKILEHPTSKGKLEVVNKLGPEYCVSIGNGNNDIDMLKTTKFSFAVINRDGCNAKLIKYADLIFKSTCDALDSLIDTRIIISLLRE